MCVCVCVVCVCVCVCVCVRACMLMHSQISSGGTVNWCMAVTSRHSLTHVGGFQSFHCMGGVCKCVCVSIRRLAHFIVGLGSDEERL